MRTPALAALVLAAASVGIAAPATAQASTTSPAVASLVLPASAFGHGLKREYTAVSKGLKYPTLEICGYSFHSDEKRLERVQPIYTKKGSKTLDMSEEVVHYKHGAIKGVRSDIKGSATSCNGGRTLTYDDGSTATYTDKVITLKGAPSGSLVVKETYASASGTGTSVLIYQTHGDYLVAIYAAATPTAESIALHAARVVAPKLAKL